MLPYGLNSSHGAHQRSESLGIWAVILSTEVKMTAIVESLWGVLYFPLLPFLMLCSALILYSKEFGFLVLRHFSE